MFTPGSRTSTRARYDQIKEQLRLTIETIKERQEGELINNPDYGLLANVGPVAADLDPGRSAHPGRSRSADHQGVEGAGLLPGPPGWRSPPSAGSAPGAGVPPPTVSLFGSQFLTWRGLPIIPSDKVPVVANKTKFLLLRTGEKRQGVVGLFQPGLAGEQGPGLSVRFMGINRSAIASYLISLYCSLAVLTDDALAVLDDVEIDKYHDYAPKYRK